MAFTLGELAALVGGELRGPADLVIGAIAAVDQADSRDITFITARRYVRLAETSRAAAFVVSLEFAGLSRPLIVVPYRYLAYAQVADPVRPGAAAMAWGQQSGLAGTGSGIGAGRLHRTLRLCG